MKTCPILPAACILALFVASPAFPNGWAGFGFCKYSFRDPQNSAVPGLGQAVSQSEPRRQYLFLKANGRKFLVRGGVYTPDLLFQRDEDRGASHEVAAGYCRPGVYHGAEFNAPSVLG
jgi:hypothetical protein